MQKQAVIFGAGKIARGFVAHLLALSDYKITFVEKSPELVGLLRQRGRYKVHIMGAPEKSINLEGFEVVSTDQAREVAVSGRALAARVRQAHGPARSPICQGSGLGMGRLSAEPQCCREDCES